MPRVKAKKRGRPFGSKNKTTYQSQTKSTSTNNDAIEFRKDFIELMFVAERFAKKWYNL